MFFTKDWQADGAKAMQPKGRPHFTDERDLTRHQGVVFASKDQTVEELLVVQMVVKFCFFDLR